MLTEVADHGRAELDDGVEGRTQLMANDRDELVLRGERGQR